MEAARRLNFLPPKITNVSSRQARSREGDTAEAMDTDTHPKNLHVDWTRMYLRGSSIDDVHNSVTESLLDTYCALVPDV